MPDTNWSRCGGLRVSASENLTALVGLEVLFKALAATDSGRQALHAAAEERLSELEVMAEFGLDAGPNRHAASLLREMVNRVAPAAGAA